MKHNDLVAYSAQFCRSIGAQTGPVPFRRGRFVETVVVGQREFAKVLWDDEDEERLVLMANIAQVGPNLKFCNC